MTLAPTQPIDALAVTPVASADQWDGRKNVPLPSGDFSEHQLIERAKQGDRRSCSELVRRHQDRLHRSIVAIVGSNSVAEDIVQDAFIRAFGNIRKFRGDSQFYSWLFRIAINCRRRYFSRGQPTVSLDEMVGVAESRVSPQSSPLEQLELAERRQTVRDALKRIEPHHRMILVLREYECFDYQTIATVLSIKLGTVRSRLSRARQRMRVELESPSDQLSW